MVAILLTSLILLQKALRTAPQAGDVQQTLSVSRRSYDSHTYRRARFFIRSFTFIQFGLPAIGMRTFIVHTEWRTTRTQNRWEYKMYSWLGPSNSLNVVLTRLIMLKRWFQLIFTNVGVRKCVPSSQQCDGVEWKMKAYSETCRVAWNFPLRGHPLFVDPFGDVWSLDIRCLRWASVKHKRAPYIVVMLIMVIYKTRKATHVWH